jgi:hypothetical protein
MYEVKRLYVTRAGKKKIIFGPQQLQQLQQMGDVDILVFREDDSKPVQIIPSKVIRENVEEWGGIFVEGWRTSMTRVNVTLDHDNMVQIDSLVRTGKFRTRSHALDEAVKLFLRKETVKL